MKWVLFTSVALTLQAPLHFGLAASTLQGFLETSLDAVEAVSTTTSIDPPNTFTIGSQGGVAYGRYGEQFPNVQVAPEIFREDVEVVFGISTTPATFYPKEGSVRELYDTDNIVPIGPLLRLTMPVDAIRLGAAPDGSGGDVSDALIFSPAFDLEKIGLDADIGAEIRVMFDDGTQIFLGISNSSLETASVIYNTELLLALKDVTGSTFTITL